MPTPKTSPVFRSLESTRAAVKASIADRERVKNPTPDARAVTEGEKRRLLELETAMHAEDAEAFTAIQSAEKQAAEAAKKAEEAKPAPVTPAAK